MRTVAPVILGRRVGATVSTFRNEGKGMFVLCQQFSLGDLAHIGRVPEDHCLVVLKSYFDGVGKPDSRVSERSLLLLLAARRINGHRLKAIGAR